MSLQHMFSLSATPDIFFGSLWESWRQYSWLACTNEIFLFILAVWNTSRWRWCPVGLESFVYCLFRSQLAVAIATEAHTMICGIVRFEYQLQSVLKESITRFWTVHFTITVFSRGDALLYRMSVASDRFVPLANTTFENQMNLVYLIWVKMVTVNSKYSFMWLPFARLTLSNYLEFWYRLHICVIVLVLSRNVTK